MEDGYIVIGTKVDNRGFDKDTQKLIEKAEKSSGKIERLMEQKGKLEIDNAEFEKKILESEEQLNGLRQQMKELENIKMTTTSEWEYKEADQELKNMTIQYNELVAKNEQDNKLLDIKQQKVERINRNIEREKAVRDEISKKIQQSNKGLLDIGKVTEMSDKLGNSINGAVKKVLKMSLAFIGIRTALSLITRSFNTLSQYNSDLSTKMENIKLMLAVAFEPIIMRIVSWLQTLLGYINAIYQLFTGISLKQRASELSSKKMAENMASGVGSAKEIKKQLAGFDEMNVVQDTSSSGGGGGGSAKTPEFELPDVELPQWMQDLAKWIKINKPLLLGLLAGIVTYLGLIKLGLDLISATGIALIVAGLVTSIIAIIDYLKDPSWENFGQIIQGIGIAIIGLGVIVGGLPAIIVGAIVLIVGTIVKYWEDIKAFLENILKWIRDKGNGLIKDGHSFLGTFVNMFGDLFNWVIQTLDNLFKTWKSIFDGIIKFIKGVFTGNWKQAWEGVKQVISAMVNNILGLFQNLLNLILGYFSRIGSAVGGVIGGSFKNVINAVLDWVQNKINGFIRAINKVINKVNDIPGVNITRLSEVSLPRMKTGARINQPGRGVPVGVGGEAGKEGILPLTDAKAMQLLGQEIGKWITINANITNTMNGRVISRELQKINNENDFAFNS